MNIYLLSWDSGGFSCLATVVAKNETDAWLLIIGEINDPETTFLGKCTVEYKDPELLCIEEP